MPKAIRMITYECDTIEELDHQLRKSLPDGVTRYGNKTIRITTVERDTGQADKPNEPRYGEARVDTNQELPLFDGRDEQK